MGDTYDSGSGTLEGGYEEEKKEVDNGMQIWHGCRADYLYRNSDFYGRDSKTPFGTVEKAVLKAADISGMEKADSAVIRKCYGLREKDYDGVMLYYFR